MNNEKITLYVDGMHCAACEMLTENEVKECVYVKGAKSSLKKRQIEVEGDFSGKTKEQVVGDLNGLLNKHGYKLSFDPINKKTKLSDFYFAIPFSFLFLMFFFGLQRLGLFNVLNSGEIGYGAAFLVGVVASLSTCMAVVGGLVLSLSAKFAKDKKHISSPIFFHIGRLVSFFIFGGLVGLVGSVFQLGLYGTFLIGILVSLVMFIMGLNLLEILPSISGWQFKMPRFISDRAVKVSGWTNSLAPFFIGVSTFFLPCGFTQAMQVYTLTTGSFMKGSLTMFLFALGTLPVLALLSFGAFSIKDSVKLSIFFKTVGIIVIFFSLMNFFNSFASIGLVEPFFRGSVKNASETVSYSSNVSILENKQIIVIDVGGGYFPNNTTAKAGIPTQIKFVTNKTLDCSSAVVIPSLKYRSFLPISGETDFDIPSQKSGTSLSGRCAMGMYGFKINFE